MILSLLLGFILGVAAIIFALQNTVVVSLTFLGWHFDSSLALLIVVAILFGVLLSAIVALPGAIRNSFRLRSLKKANDNLQADAEAAKQRSNQAVAERDAIQAKPTTVIEENSPRNI